MSHTCNGWRLLTAPSSSEASASAWLGGSLPAFRFNKLRQDLGCAFCRPPVRRCRICSVSSLDEVCPWQLSQLCWTDPRFQHLACRGLAEQAGLNASTRARQVSACPTPFECCVQQTPLCIYDALVRSRRQSIAALCILDPLRCKCLCCPHRSRSGCRS